MRSRRRFVYLVWAAGAVWLGCNSLLGIETAVTELDGGLTPPAEASQQEGGSDGSSSPPDGAADVVIPPDAGCGDTLSTSKHCGACNHDCLGGECVDGKCRPVVLANDAEGAFWIAIDNTHVYWSNLDTNTISRVPKDGGASQTLASATTLGNGLAVVAGEIYFPTLDGVYRCPVTGCVGPPTRVVAGPVTTMDIADGGVLTFCDVAGAQEVYRCSLPCGGSPQLIAAGGNPSSVTGTVDRVYWGTLFPGSLRVRVNGDAPATVASRGPIGNIIVTSDTLIYALDGTGPMVSLLDGGSPRQVFLGGLINCDHVALRDGHVFFNDYRSNGRIFDCPISGCGDGGVVATGQLRPRSITVDDANIYWANQGDKDAGTISRLAR